MHDVAVTDIMASAAYIPRGQPIDINVTVANQGLYPETVNVTVYADRNVGDLHFDIENDTSFLEIEASATLEFTWDTTDVPCGTYWITAEAVILEDDDLEDNIARIKVGGIGVPYQQRTANISTLLAPLALTIFTIAAAGSVAIGLFKLLTSIKLGFSRRVDP